MKTCTICQHPKAWSIDRAIAYGCPLRTIAVLADVTKDSLARHKKHFNLRKLRKLSRTIIWEPLPDNFDLNPLLAANWKAPDPDKLEWAMRLSDPEGEEP